MEKCQQLYEIQTQKWDAKMQKQFAHEGMMERKGEI